MAKIYLFRHGETHFNKQKRFTGWMDATWTTEGKKNAQTTARKLKSKTIHVAFSSHLKRSRGTLAEVLKFHPECKMKFIDDRMIERCYGRLQGHSHNAFIAQHGKELFDLYHRSYDFPPPNGESVRMVENRVTPFIKLLVKFIKKYNVNVAISAHGNSMRPFRKKFEKLSTKQMMTLENPYDNSFEYTIPTKGKTVMPKKSVWKEARLPKHVLVASDKHNNLKKYY